MHQPASQELTNLKKATSKDVARLAGVSQSTVSLILNNKQNVSFSEETIHRVKEAARKLNYEPPRSSQVFSFEPKGTILLFAPTMSNPYYPVLTEVIEQSAAARGHAVLLINTYRSKEAEKTRLTSLIDRGDVAGIIFSFSPSYPDLLEQVSKSLPVVIVGEKDDALGIDTVGLNSYTSGRLVAEHLIQLGHEDMAFISGPVNNMSLSRSKRLEGIKDRLREAGLDGRLIVELAEEESESRSGVYEIEVGYELTLRLLEKHPEVTAIIGVNDMTASGAMKALHSKGIRIPDDISVCGFDNIFVCAIVNPGLTTIDHALEHRASVAVDILLKKIESKAESSQNGHGLLSLSQPRTLRIEYEPQLIVRDSTGKRRKACLD
jgi:LacI family transcriptional regulator